MKGLHSQSQHKDWRRKCGWWGPPLHTINTIYQKIQRVKPQPPRPTVKQCFWQEVSEQLSPKRRAELRRMETDACKTPKFFCVEASHPSCMNTDQKWKWEGWGSTGKSKSWGQLRRKGTMWWWRRWTKNENLKGRNGVANPAPHV